MLKKKRKNARRTRKKNKKKEKEEEEDEEGKATYYYATYYGISSVYVRLHVGIMLYNVNDNNNKSDFYYIFLRSRVASSKL